MGNYESLISSFATVNEYIIFDDDNKSITNNTSARYNNFAKPSRKLQLRFSRSFPFQVHRVLLLFFFRNETQTLRCWVIRETVRITRRVGVFEKKTKIFGRAKCERRNDSLRRRREQDAISISHLHIDGISKSYEYFTTLSVLPRAVPSTVDDNANDVRPLIGLLITLSDRSTDERELASE